jgi:hypothetical protein
MLTLTSHKKIKDANNLFHVPLKPGLMPFLILWIIKELFQMIMLSGSPCMCAHEVVILRLFLISISYYNHIALSVFIWDQYFHWLVITDIYKQAYSKIM